MIEPDRNRQHQNPQTNYDQLLDSEHDYRAFLAKVDFITDKIAIGNRAQLEDPTALKPYHFKSVLSLDNAITQLPIGETIEQCHHFPLIDGPDNDFNRFERAVFTLRELVDKYSPVFVHCHAGRSRSPAVVAAYLVLDKKIDAQLALEFVDSKRQISIHPALIELVYRFGDRHGDIE